jgi:RNA polymerase II subunit A small phosphatase-like protein
MSLLVILDLDETLVHAPERPFAGTPDFHAAGYPIFKRPHVDAFLAGLLASYRVAVWTASGSLYAEPIVRHLFGDPARLAFVWSAERCTQHFDHETRRRSTLKLLTKVRRRGYDLDRVLCVDDSPEKHVRNYGNLVRVTPFEGDPADDELLVLLPYLHRLAAEPSVRRVEKRGWRRLQQGAPAAPPVR